jgi:hypothetical protein
MCARHFGLRSAWHGKCWIIRNFSNLSISLSVVDVIDNSSCPLTLARKSALEVFTDKGNRDHGDRWRRDEAGENSIQYPTQGKEGVFVENRIPSNSKCNTKELTGEYITPDIT